MQTIETTYHGPSCLKGARIVARATSGIKVETLWNGDLDTEENHRLACQSLMAKLNWDGDMVGGSIKGGGMVWVFSSGSPIA